MNMKKSLLVATLAGLALTASAQTFTLPTGSTEASVKTRAAKTAASPKPTHVKKAMSVEDSLTTNFGEKVSVMQEDFSKFSTGEVGNPDKNTNINYKDSQYPVWINVAEEYTSVPGWGAYGAYPAGGSVCIDALSEYAHINTPMLTLGGNEGIAVLKFKARADEGSTATDIAVEAAETFNMSPTWDILEGYSIDEITDEWTTYEFIFTHCGDYTIFNIAPNSNCRFYIDDLEVYQIKPNLTIPKNVTHTDFTGDSFTAKWDAVEGAESYLVNLSKVEIVTGLYYDYPEYTLLQADVPATANELSLTGLDINTTYLFTVRAVQGDKVSMASDSYCVFDLLAPTLNPVEAGTEPVGSYLASWTEVPTAERYMYWAYDKRVAAESGTFTVTDENFSNITLPNGDEPSYTLDNHEFDVYGDGFLKGLSQGGWKGYNYMPYADGVVCVDAYHYLYNHENACIISPELDLSKNGGEFTVNLKLMGEYASFWDSDNVQHDGVVQCAVALFNYNEETGEFEQEALIYPGEVQDDSFQEFTARFSDGTSRSKVGIFGVRYPGNLWISSVKIEQDYQAGESLLEPYYVADYVEGTSVTVPFTKAQEGLELYHKVSAVKTSSVPELYSGVKESAFSALEKVDVVVDGIRNVDVAGSNLMLDGNRLTIAGNAAVEVYGLNGTLVGKSSANGSIELPARGVYVVKTAGKAVKVRF